jgi:hypothetical protein
MKRMLYTAVITWAMTATAWGNPEAAEEKPYIFASQSAQVTALVEAIDHDSRELTLRGPQGNAITFIVGEEARNLGQVEVGDLVNAEYVRSLSIEVIAGNGMEAGAGGISALGRTAEGAMPGAAVMDTQVVTATVEEINVEANTFKLKFPDGAVQQFTARDPENLKRADVGDLVVITTTEALAIAVEKTHSE